MQGNTINDNNCYICSIINLDVQEKTKTQSNKGKPIQ
ncbi:hypothetical protein IWX83_003087 [Flavobacterium sp. CG_9.1]|jgi:hypothetical protein|nr:hypothetical protein [Flavobacterium sp. CG_9.1]